MIDLLGKYDGRIVIAGSGLAGLMTALTLAPQPVVLITRAALGTETSSAWAQGGIAAALGSDDDPQLHLADTIAAGDGLCDAEVVRTITAAAPAVIATLERLGVRFDRDDTGALSLGLEAAHARRRIVHASGDASGASIIEALTWAAATTPSITVLERAEVRELLVEQGAVTGLVVARGKGVFAIRTSRVVLATGGIGGLYDHTTNPTSNFGQGIAVAARAGADVADMEFVQFHPTALVSNSRPLALVSEAVRGEGAILVNDRGERFMAGTDGGELAPRDVVARAISAEISAGRRVFLDARQSLGPHFAARFPTIDRLCRNAGIDPARQVIPVCPAVHYHMGGIVTDLRGRSSLPGLWVVGEAASTGLHGANRLASNSLLEAAAMGLCAGHDLAGTTADPVMPVPMKRTVSPMADASIVRPFVSRHFGVLRNATSLRAAIAGLLPLAESEAAAANPACVGLLMAVSALLRTESRGAHARTDFPSKDATARRRIMTLAEALDFARDHTQTLARSA
ncbi:L-aspartate oxidase [Rhizobium sp. S152]|uniref:L-aspartate oxidase n=1 Tax=Rhizobium sp. S152 TaxID=3055038 RepID=UPI0025A9B9D6|nr:L-aspartate oxidase [Rhizobium sp. S152]MDM9625535.1 L-aspartate oxidase [Rhizobium sp. S152]